VGILGYENKIDQAIKKRAAGISDDEKQDLKQECWLALHRASEIESDAVAYKICEQAIIAYLYRQKNDRVTDKPEFISSSWPGVEHAAEKANKYEPDYEGFLDSEAVRKSLKTLLTPQEAQVICLLYGFGCEAIGQVETAIRLAQTRRWVEWKLKTAMEKLRAHFIKEKT